MSRINGVTRGDIWRGHEMGSLRCQEVTVIAIQVFLRNKRGTGRPEDRAGTEALREPEK